MDIDYCLACDGPSEHGAYCSHACRSADIERCKPAPTTTNEPSTSESLPELFEFSLDFKTYDSNSSISSATSQPSSKRSSMSGISMTSNSSLKNRYDYLWKQETPLSAEARATLFQYEGYFNQSIKKRPALYKRYTLG